MRPNACAPGSGKKRWPRRKGAPLRNAFSFRALIVVFGLVAFVFPVALVAQAGLVGRLNATLGQIALIRQSQLLAASLERALCASEGKPANALRHTCQTSIIRDELITSLSFDLTEGELFSLVYDAQGVVDRPDHGRRAQDIEATVKEAVLEYGRAYEEMRERFNQALTDVSAAKDKASKAGDVSSALSLIDNELKGSPDSVSEKLLAAREMLTERRLKLNEVNSLAEEERALLAARSGVGGSESQSQRIR